MAREGGYAATTVEVLDDADQDMLRLVGIMNAMWQMMRVKEYGTLWGSGDCKTFLNFISRYTFGRDRHDNILGKEDQTVQDANDCAQVLYPCTL